MDTHLIDNYPLSHIIRQDDHQHRITTYLEIHCYSFTFQHYDFGSKELKERYGIDKKLYRYFNKRNFLFSKFEEGIQIDQESWYSVIPQPVSIYLKERLLKKKINKIFQPFCGVGGIAIHLAGNFQEYIVNDIDRNKIKMLRHNLKVYGKETKSLKYLSKDFLQIQPFQTDAIIVCPPWGGIHTSQYATHDFDSIMHPQLSLILTHALKFSTEIILQMPKQTNINNLIKMIHKVGIRPIFTIEKIQTNEICSQLFIYFGSQAFTNINTVSLTACIIRDSQSESKAVRKKIKQLLKQKKSELMKQIYSISFPNKHIFLS